ncbi:MAG TPA: glycerophosphodiester phosphodiesterase [Thermomicrobiales bacterium]|nr:glycerophosphodiester phosphodiesterase [Thermomicrobiales bacterium]
MTAREGSTYPPPGRGLPAPLADRLAAGHWLRTAHRGAPTVAPGNSRAAIAAAAALGVDLVEVDVHATADGQLALWHDDEVPAGRARLRIAATPLAELQRVEVGQGERVITLADAMEAVRGRAALLVDLKADGLAEPIVATARRLDFGPVVVCGGYWESLRDVKRLAPEIGTSLTLDRDWRARYGDDAIERAGTDALTVDARILREPGLLARCHARGLAVLAWTVDRPADMRALLALGVDGLTSNRPDLFATL